MEVAANDKTVGGAPGEKGGLAEEPMLEQPWVECPQAPMHAPRNEGGLAASIR